MTEKISSQNARQGRSGTRVFKVLVAAVTLSLIVWLGLELVWT